LLVVKG
jgi:hypothetical protein